MGSTIPRSQINFDVKYLKVNVFGDSRKVTKKMRFGYNMETSICKRIYNRISHLNKPLEVSFFLVLQENNGFTRELANQGSRIAQGLVSYANGEKSVKHVPRSILFLAPKPFFSCHLVSTEVHN